MADLGTDLGISRHTSFRTQSFYIKKPVDSCRLAFCVEAAEDRPKVMRRCFQNQRQQELLFREWAGYQVVSFFHKDVSLRILSHRYQNQLIL